MLKNSLSFMLGIVLFGMSLVTLAQTAADQVTVKDPYVRAVPPGQPNSASFMTLYNEGKRQHALVGAESPVAKIVELHTHNMVDGMMRMRPVDKVDLPAGKVTGLEPGGLHVMLIGLEQQLVPDETVSLTLIFEDGSKKKITMPVRKLRMRMKKTHQH